MVIFIKKAFSTTFVALWRITIFAFSAQPADESTDTSHAVGRFIGGFVISDFEQWEPEKQESFASQIDFSVRKISHAMEYAFLCILFFLMFHSYGVQAGRGPWWALLCTIGYSVTDEVHQLFVPGRCGRILDVLIDGVGAAVGGCIVWIFLSFFRKKTQFTKISQ